MTDTIDSWSCIESRVDTEIIEVNLKFSSEEFMYNWMNDPILLLTGVVKHSQS